MLKPAIHRVKKARCHKSLGFRMQNRCSRRQINGLGCSRRQVDELDISDTTQGRVSKVAKDTANQATNRAANTMEIWILISASMTTMGMISAPVSEVRTNGKGGATDKIHIQSKAKFMPMNSVGSLKWTVFKKVFHIVRRRKYSSGLTETLSREFILRRFKQQSMTRS